MRSLITSVTCGEHCQDGRRLPDELREAAGLLRQAKIAEETAIEHIKAYLDG